MNESESVHVLFRAFQMPGCVKEINPTRTTLKSGLRNHRVKVETGFDVGEISSPATTSFENVVVIVVMMFGCFSKRFSFASSRECRVLIHEVMMSNV
jgi:hypothetical protein